MFSARLARSFSLSCAAPIPATRHPPPATRHPPPTAPTSRGSHAGTADGIRRRPRRRRRRFHGGAVWAPERRDRAHGAAAGPCVAYPWSAQRPAHAAPAMPRLAASGKSTRGCAGPLPPPDPRGPPGGPRVSRIRETKKINGYKDRRRDAAAAPATRASAPSVLPGARYPTPRLEACDPCPAAYQRPAIPIARVQPVLQARIWAVSAQAPLRCGRHLPVQRYHVVFKKVLPLPLLRTPRIPRVRVSADAIRVARSARGTANERMK